MRIANDELPDDIETLKRLIRQRDAELQQRDTELQQRDLQIEQRNSKLREQAERLARTAEQIGEQRNEVVTLRLFVEKLKLQIAKLRRMQFGRSSERHDGRVAQLELIVDELEASLPPEPERPDPDAAGDAPAGSKTARKPARRPLPEHLPREDREHVPACACPDCGSALKKIGEDVSEQLEYVPEHFKAIRHRRPKMACPKCSKIVQMPAPSRPIDKGLAGPGLLAHVAVSKYLDHLPLYRQSEIYARQGVEIDRSTMAEWIGGIGRLVQPLVDAVGRYVTAANKLHADDTLVPVLDPGRGKTKTGRLWVYVRDDRPAGSTDPPAAWYRYTPTREGVHPQAHLAGFRGILQADGFAGFDALFATGRIVEAACWAHARRKFYDLHVATKSPIAAEALDRIKELYKIEDAVRGRPPQERLCVRQEQAAPLLESLNKWLQETKATVSAKSELASAINYSLNRWEALTRYSGDGCIEADNNAAERALRGPVLGRKNYLFAGADSGGERAAAMYTLLQTAKLNGVNPEAYLREVLARIADHPVNRINELLPWNLVPAVAETEKIAA
jgi:transposase